MDEARRIAAKIAKLLLAPDVSDVRSLQKRAPGVK
jgi:hypothetical protein